MAPPIDSGSALSLLGMTGTTASRVLLQDRYRRILRLNDVPEMRELFAWATIETVELSYQVVGKRVRGLVMS